MILKIIRETKVSRNLGITVLCIVVLSENLANCTAPFTCPDWCKPTGPEPLPPNPENRTRTKEVEHLLNRGEPFLWMQVCTTNSSIYALSTKNGINDKSQRWTNLHVYPDPSYSDLEYELINSAMYRLQEALPCVGFRIWPRDSKPAGDYVHILKKGGCWSNLGRWGGRQEMSVDNDCMRVSTIVHQLIHALGFHHEHQRPDRDEYVNIIWENVETDKEHNFRRLNPWQWITFDVPYNIYSIMHYSSNALSKNGRPTIYSKNHKTVGSPDGELTWTDIQKLRRMYECPL